MPKVCVVYRCSNRSNREKNKRFFRVPKVVRHKGPNFQNLTERRRKQWLDNLRLKSGGAETANATVCSDHFLKGCPSAAKDLNSEDWAPTLNLGYFKCDGRPQTEPSRQREERAAAREQPCIEEANSDVVPWDGGSPLSDDEFFKDAECQTELEAANSDAVVCDEESPVPDEEFSKECQTDQTMADLTSLEDAVNSYTSEICGLREKVRDTKVTPETFKDNDKTKFYTGLPNFLVLMQIFQLCEQYITVSSLSVLSKFEQFVMVLMRLRLNLQLQDLAYRFNVSAATVSRIWIKMIHVLHDRLEFLIEWPEREIMQSTMPMSFRKAFGLKVAVILDCFELFTEKPSTCMAGAQTWFNYKDHNTVKYLIGISPHGSVTYISSVWGGRTSDKQITEECGILDKLLPGDVVLADRGFAVEDGVGFYCASLKTPAFTEGKKKLPANEVEQTRKLAGVRTHVERVIGLVRRRYQILQSRTMPIGHMAVKSTDSLALVDKIVVICCALSNLSESIVPQEQGVMEKI